MIQGETLWRIAHHYGVSVNLLIKTNAIGDPTEPPSRTAAVCPACARVRPR